MPHFTVIRSATIPAPLEDVRGHIRDLRRWEAWSPWQQLDPQMQQTYSGPEAGVGAHMAWEGNKQAGAGSMTIVTDEPSLVEVDLEFAKPMRAKHRASFTLSSVDENSTVVTWAMTGKQNLAGKVFFTVFGMDKKIAADFDKGLNALAEAAAS